MIKEGCENVSAYLIILIYHKNLAFHWIRIENGGIFTKGAGFLAMTVCVCVYMFIYVCI